MMNEVNKTLYIPLYGKAFVSKKGIILNDKTAEVIWEKEGFKLKGKSRSKYLAYYMGMRSRVFDDWLCTQMSDNADSIVIHIGCGLDSRINRVGTNGHLWYDVDFSEVVEERRRYYRESDKYKMLACDAREPVLLDALPRAKHAIVVMEGVSMYLSPSELNSLILRICNSFEKVSLLMDCYTTFAARASKIKNPINDVGVTEVYGIDDPKGVAAPFIAFIKEHEMTPNRLIEQLAGIEKGIFKTVYAGRTSKKLYRLYEYQKG